MRGMAAQIHEITTGAVGGLFGPILLIVPIILVLATITGTTGRVAIVLEDLRYKRIHRRNRLAGVSPSPFGYSPLDAGAAPRSPRVASRDILTIVDRTVTISSEVTADGGSRRDGCGGIRRLAVPCVRPGSSRRPIRSRRVASVVDRRALCATGRADSVGNRDQSQLRLVRLRNPTRHRQGSVLGVDGRPARLERRGAHHDCQPQRRHIDRGPHRCADRRRRRRGHPAPGVHRLQALDQRLGPDRGAQPARAHRRCISDGPRRIGRSHGPARGAADDPVQSAQPGRQAVVKGGARSRRSHLRRERCGGGCRRDPRRSGSSSERVRAVRNGGARERGHVGCDPRPHQDVWSRRSL